MAVPRQNLICNFRAPDVEHFRVWQDFKEVARNMGLDICFLTLTLCEAWLKAVNESKEVHQIVTPSQIINLQQQNTFVYSVKRPRRETPDLFCPRKAYSRTITSRAFQSYVMEKARELERSFSFRDFLELGHRLFRKCILTLKKRRKILPLEPRTNPRFYVLRERVSDYPTMKGNTIVKPRFTGETTRRGE